MRRSNMEGTKDQGLSSADPSWPFNMCSVSINIRFFFFIGIRNKRDHLSLNTISTILFQFKSIL